MHRAAKWGKERNVDDRLHIEILRRLNVSLVAVLVSVIKTIIMTTIITTTTVTNIITIKIIIIIIITTTVTTFSTPPLAGSSGERGS
jgi:membrane glycosyltransferase